MHSMVYHIPKFFETHKSVKLFTEQGVEKNNDMAKIFVLHKFYKWDAVTDSKSQGNGSSEEKKGLKGHIPRKILCIGSKK